MKLHVTYELDKALSGIFIYSLGMLQWAPDTLRWGEMTLVAVTVGAIFGVDIKPIERK